jgi:hypothetical protein
MILCSSAALVFSLERNQLNQAQPLIRVNNCPIWGASLRQCAYILVPLVQLEQASVCRGYARPCIRKRNVTLATSVFYWYREDRKLCNEIHFGCSLQKKRGGRRRNRKIPTQLSTHIVNIIDKRKDCSNLYTISR